MQKIQLNQNDAINEYNQTSGVVGANGSSTGQVSGLDSSFLKDWVKQNNKRSQTSSGMDILQKNFSRTISSKSEYSERSKENAYSQRIK